MNFLIGLVPNEDGGDTPSSHALRKLAMDLTPTLRKALAEMIEGMEASRLAATEDTESILEALAWCRQQKAIICFTKSGSVIVSQTRGDVWEHEASTFVEAVRAAQKELIGLVQEEDSAADADAVPIYRPASLPDHIDVSRTMFRCYICGDQSLVTHRLDARDAIESPLPHLGLVRMLHIYVNEHPDTPHPKPVSTQVLQFRLQDIDAVTSDDPLVGLRPIRTKADVAD